MNNGNAQCTPAEWKLYATLLATVLPRTHFLPTVGIRMVPCLTFLQDPCHICGITCLWQTPNCQRHYYTVAPTYCQRAANIRQYGALVGVSDCAIRHYGVTNKILTRELVLLNQLSSQSFNQSCSQAPVTKQSSEPQYPLVTVACDRFGSALFRRTHTAACAGHNYADPCNAHQNYQPSAAPYC